MLVFIRTILQKLETSTDKMFLISVEQLWMSTNILSVKLYLAALLFTYKILCSHKIIYVIGPYSHYCTEYYLLRVVF
jgi:hypothetical protein